MYNLYNVENINGSVQVRKVEDFENEAKEIVLSLSLKVLMEFNRSDDELFGFRNFGNVFSKIVKSDFKTLMTLTENRRSMPFKFNKFLIDRPKYVIMFGDALGQLLVDNSFPRVPEFVNYIDDILNKNYTLKTEMFYQIIEIEEFENLDILILQSGRKRIVKK
jgi:hypothetical protein